MGKEAHGCRRWRNGLKLQVVEEVVVDFELVAALGRNPALEVVNGCPSCYQEEVEGQLLQETEEWLLHQ